MKLGVSRLWIVILFLVISVSALVWVAVSQDSLSGVPLLGDTDFVSIIRSWGNWGMTGSISLMVLHSFVPFPAEALAMANGVLYGPLLGSIITWTGAMMGALVAFGCTRLFGRRFAMRWLPQERWSSLETWSLRHGWQALLVVRLIPVVSFNLINFAVGLTPVSLWTFTWTTGLGIIPVVVISVWLGDQASALPAWAWLSLALLAVICVLLIGWLSRSRTEREETSEPDQA
jgi:uncharacterized membrane protein YdjX (TVP38/TMEM64 family)